MHQFWKYYTAKRGRGLLEVPCAFNYNTPAFLSVCLSVCLSVRQWDHHEGRGIDFQFLSKKNRLALAGALNFISRKSVHKKCSSFRLFSYCHLECMECQVFEEEILLSCNSCWSAAVAFPDGTGVGKLLRWTQVFTQCSNWKNWHLKCHRHSKNLPRTSPTLPLPHKCSACMSHTVHYHTVYVVVQPAVKCSAVCAIVCRGMRCAFA